MTTLWAGTPSYSPARGTVTGVGMLIRLGMRRERIGLAVWIYAVCLTLIASFPTLKALYPDQASREAIAGGIAGTPAFVVMTGPVDSTTLGGLTAWRYGVLGAVAVALMAILITVRRTRADEEAGRTELLAAGVLGRRAQLAAALALSCGAAITIGVVVAVGAIILGQPAVGAIILGQPAAGSVVLGAAFAGPGIAFAVVAAVAAQLVESSRAATGFAGAALALAAALVVVGLAAFRRRDVLSA